MIGKSFSYTSLVGGLLPSYSEETPEPIDTPSLLLAPMQRQSLNTDVFSFQTQTDWRTCCCWARIQLTQVH